MMEFLRKARREISFVKDIRLVLKTLKELTPESTVTIADEIEASVDREGAKPAFVFEGQDLSYADFDKRANRIAHWALSQGLQPGDTVALMLENCPDYLATWFGLSKVGVVSALINTNLQGEGLAHCLSIVESKAIIAGGTQAERVEEVLTGLTGDIALWDFDGKTGHALEEALAAQSDTRPPADVRAGLDGRATALFVYTSGTTGLPKAARITQMRLRGMARFALFLGKVSARDRVYNALPLYHSTGGLLGAGGALIFGATTILRRKFSASGFWDDVTDNRANKFVYIGELCRYLLNAKPHPKERAHELEAGFGNGMRGEVWVPFVERFGVPAIHEFYGSTEGNVSFLNFDGTIGAIGRMPKWLEKRIPIAFVKFDVDKEEPIRGADGFCIRTDDDEVGEALGKIEDGGASEFAGYHDKKATEAKILTDVFEKGDRWFRTGDLLRRDSDGYVYFVDRIGDTFRWKGENVATNEVSDAVSKYAGVGLANVYGVEVPGTDGRAGMVALTVDDSFKVDGLATHLHDHLPPYAVPLFLRVQSEADTTGTMKFRKVDLVKEGFNTSQISDPVWFLDPEAGTYVPLEKNQLERLNAGSYRL
ncbi:long-chain-acyl-CoA synthetase [Qipengyuania flava]|uniref:long-chain-acyl-CoA synthetase n=1 Tax=Qipengyuania flava TaxID=192812 RepID=UPI001C638ED8|nr:long-chain-acyl-CoA synthetase [Qipengyuania flava]QYJ07798.1 long-chain-acyl-CoA synthetase [Qipengyuania flava]